MMCDELNKVILIGGNHHNGLNLARIFGINGIKPYGIIIRDRQKMPYTALSKYWEKTWIVDKEEDVLDKLLYLFSDETKRPVIIPWSDGCAALIDRNINRLKDKYILPSINGLEGEIVKYMNKEIQSRFAKKHGIQTAKTWVVQSTEDLPTDISYPCIVKPVVSFEGEKSDIKKCNDYDSLFLIINDFQQKKYRRMLIQEFIDFDYEFIYEGCCGRDISFYAVKNMRGWPVVGGTGSYGQVLLSESIESIGRKLFIALSELGYSGLIDIDMFFVNGEVFLNEINWRNGARVFVSLSTKVYYPLIWYLSVIGRDSKSLIHFPENESYSMDETLDLRHVVSGNISVFTWNRDRLKAKCYALWNKHDMKPVFSRYVDLIAELIKRKGRMS